MFTLDLESARRDASRSAFMAIRRERGVSQNFRSGRLPGFVERGAYGNLSGDRVRRS